MLNSAKAQTYCSPTFSSGCINWSNLSVTAGTINWTNIDCTISDYTILSTTATPGVALPMAVESGTWTGCAVWVDFDYSGDFTDNENLFNSYVGGSPSYTYNFDITIPPGTADSTYRMRIVAGWGTDGFNPGANGYGACGMYQYGNFNDFSLVVSSVTNVKTIELEEAQMSVAPNPANEELNLQFSKNFNGTLLISDIAGHTVDQIQINGKQKLTVNTESLPSGLYIIRNSSFPSQNLKVQVLH